MPVRTQVVRGGEVAPARESGHTIHATGLLPLPHVQLRQTENRSRLARPCRRCNRCAISYLVAVAAVRLVNFRILAAP